MAQNIYQLTIRVTDEDNCETYHKTFLFTDMEKAKTCVNTLYGKRFDNIEGVYSYRKNPFNGYGKDEQSCVKEDKIIEDGMLVGFKLYERYSYTSLSVMISKKFLDLDSNHWEF